MVHKLKGWLFTVNLTFLLIFHLFLIILGVLALTAGVGWLSVRLGWIQLDRILSPYAVLVVVFCASILMGVSMVVTIRKVILAPVQAMVSAMERLGEGDFTVRMSCRGWMRPLELHSYTAAFNAAAQELGNTQLLRKDFINNFSHEFKTPITSLGGFADLLLEDPDLPPAERQEYLTIISQESRRLAALADSILRLSRISAQTILPHSQTFSLAEQLRQCALVVGQKWREKPGVHLSVSLPSQDPCLCAGDPEMLQEVWMNLLDNAFKFSDQEGEVALSLERSGLALVVTVADRGPGMDRETQERIFDQFYQGDTSHRTQGNGLGLALVKKILELHQGEITVESQPGKGSRFQVTLPQSRKK